MFHWHKSVTFHGIQIIGGSAFRARTIEALQLLISHSVFPLLQRHVKIIRQGSRSGMRAWDKEPTFIVGRRTWRHSAIWYAGAIVHDSYHSRLYYDAKTQSCGTEPDADSWTGIEAEKKCLRFQREVLAELGANAEIIDYIERCEKNPAYAGHNTSWRAWVDYLKRWW